MVLYCTIALYFIVVYGMTTALLTKCCRKLEEKFQKPVRYTAENELIKIALLGVTMAALMIISWKEPILLFIFSFIEGFCVGKIATCLFEAVLVLKGLKKVQ